MEDLRSEDGLNKKARGGSRKSHGAEMANRHLIIDLGTGKKRPVVARPPVLSTAGSNWHGVSLEQHRGGSVETLDFISPKHVVVVQLNRAAICEFRNGSGGFRPCRIEPGQVVIFPAMTPHSIRTTDVGEFVAVRLDPQLVLGAGHELLAASDVEITTRFATKDPLLGASALALKAEAEAGIPTGSIYAESLANAMAVHLVRHHSTTGGRFQTARHFGKGRLTGKQLRRVVDFIQAHLEHGISLNALAASIRLSPYHFARVFKQSTGLAPHQFVIRCRVQKARELLLTEHDIADVALRVGFCDQSHFATHFKRIYGITPRVFLRQTLGRRVR